MRPLWAHYPTEAAVFAIEDQWLIGSDLMIKPITAAGVKSTTVYFPGDQPWYDVVTHAATNRAPGASSVDAPIDKIPVYQRGGSIIPRKMRLRRSSATMVYDPYTLVVALDNAGQASGELYMDDEHTFDFKQGKFCLRRFVFSKGTLKGEAVTSGFAPVNTVERVVILGLGAAPSAVKIQIGDETARELTFDYDANAKTLVVRKPAMPAAGDFTMALEE